MAIRSGLVAVLLVAAACGGGSPSSSGGPTTTSARPPAKGHPGGETTRTTTEPRTTTSAHPPPPIPPTTEPTTVSGPDRSSAPGPTAAPSTPSTPSTVAPTGPPVLLGRPGEALIAAGTLRLTLVRVIDPAQPAPGVQPAGPGERFMAAELNVDNLGAGAITAPVAAALTVTDDEDQSFQVGGGPVTGCAALAPAPELAPHGAASGCLAFAVPASSTLTKVTFTPSDGSDPVSWRLGS